MRSLRVKVINGFEARIRASLRMLSPELRFKIADNAGRVVVLLREHVDAVMAKTVARRGATGARLQTGDVLRSQHGAAKALQPVLSKCDPMLILVRAAAIMLMYAERPEMLMRSDAVYKACLFHSVRRLHRLAERYYWDQRRAHTKHGGSRSLYTLPTMRAREIGADWILDSLVPAAMVLLRTVRAAEGVHRVEVKLARDLGAQSEAEIADRITRLRLAARWQLKDRRRKDKRLAALSAEAPPSSS
jgi:hypothetical protein